MRSTEEELKLLEETKEDSRPKEPESEDGEAKGGSGRGGRRNRGAPM
jgi:hypothetical protein